MILRYYVWRLDCIIWIGYGYTVGLHILILSTVLMVLMVLMVVVAHSESELKRISRKGGFKRIKKSGSKEEFSFFDKACVCWQESRGKHILEWFSRSYIWFFDPRRHLRDRGCAIFVDSWCRREQMPWGWCVKSPVRREPERRLWSSCRASCNVHITLPALLIIRPCPICCIARAVPASGNFDFALGCCRCGILAYQETSIDIVII